MVKKASENTKTDDRAALCRADLSRLRGGCLQGRTQREVEPSGRRKKARTDIRAASVPSQTSLVLALSRRAAKSNLPD